jgi:hypothetical protein
VGNVASVAGEAALDNDQLRRPVELERRQRIAWGDVIVTQRNAQAQLLLLDRSNFGIGQRSRVRIDRYVYDPGEGRSLIATLLEGALRFLSGSREGRNSGEVVTPAGRIGIRGTAVDMLVGKEAKDIAQGEAAVGRLRSDTNEATLVVLRGPGARARSGVQPGLVEVAGAGVTVMLDEPGLAAYIPREGAAPIGPFRISSRGLARVQDEIMPRWARSFGSKGIPDEVLIGAGVVGILGAILGSRRSNDEDGKAGTTKPSQPTTRSPNSSSSDQRPRICRDAEGKVVPCQ